MAFSRNLPQFSSLPPKGIVDLPRSFGHKDLRPQEPLEPAGSQGFWKGRCFCLREFPASPSRGVAGEVGWTQTLGKIRLHCVFSSPELADITAKDIDLQMSSWEIKVRIRDRPRDAEPFLPICGDLFGDVRRELSWWTWEVVEGRATFTMEMTKRHLKSWANCWRVGMNLHRKQHFGWNDRMKAPMKKAEEMLVKVMPGRPAWVDVDPGVSVQREILNPSYDTYQTNTVAQIRLHLEDVPLEQALEQVGIEDLIGVDVMEKHIRLFIRGDVRNPLIIAELGGRVLPEQTQIEYTRPADLQTEGMSAIIVRLVKHPQSNGRWPGAAPHNGVMKENLAAEMGWGGAPEALDELPKLLLSRAPRAPSPDRSRWTPEQLAAESKGKGDDCAKRSDWRDAAVHYSRAISQNPTDSKLFSNRAACYLRLAKFDKALKNAERSIALDPSWAKAYFRQGQAFRGLQQWKDARNAFAEGRFLDPDNAEWEKEIQRTDDEEHKWDTQCRLERKDKREADMTTELNEATSKAESEVIAHVTKQALQAGRTPKEAAELADKYAQKERDRIIAEKAKAMMMLGDNDELGAPPPYRILNEDGTLHPKGFDITKDGKYFMGLVTVHTDKASETQPWIEIRHPGKLVWSQNCTLIRLKVYLPDSVRGAADLSVKVFPSGIRIGTVGDPEPIVQGTFERGVERDGENFCWYLVPDERPPVLEMIIDKDQAEIYATSSPIYLNWERLFDDDVKLGVGLFEADATDLPPELLNKIKRQYAKEDEKSRDDRARKKFMTEQEIADEMRGTWRGQGDSYGMPHRRIEDWEMETDANFVAAHEAAQARDSTAHWDQDLGQAHASPPRPPGRDWTRYSDADDGDWWHYDGPLGQWWCYAGEDPSPYDGGDEE